MVGGTSGFPQVLLDDGDMFLEGGSSTFCLSSLRGRSVPGSSCLLLLVSGVCFCGEPRDFGGWLMVAWVVNLIVVVRSFARLGWESSGPFLFFGELFYVCEDPLSFLPV